MLGKKVSGNMKYAIAQDGLRRLVIPCNTNFTKLPNAI